MSLGLSTMSETTRIVHDKRPQENFDPVTGFGAGWQGHLFSGSLGELENI